MSMMVLEDPEDLSLAQQRLRERERDRERDRSDKDRSSGGSSGVPISPYGPAAGLVNRLGLSSKMGIYRIFQSVLLPYSVK